MNKVLLSGLVSAIVLLAFSYLSLFLMPLLLPGVAEEYYHPAFVNDAFRNNFYYVQPVVLGFSLAWFWNRFKSVLKGNWFLQGIEMGFLYLLIATLPAMILIYSAIDVHISVVVTWLLYGFLQAIFSGLIFSKMHV